METDERPIVRLVRKSEGDGVVEFEVVNVTTNALLETVRLDYRNDPRAGQAMQRWRRILKSKYLVAEVFV